MTEKELRKKLKLKSGELVNTNLGALDIFGIKDNIVSYGFLSQSQVKTESVDLFLKHFEKNW